MRTNIGNIDRAIGLVIAVAIISLTFFKVFTGTAALVLLIAAAILAITSFVSICPLYTLLGINTCRKQPSK